MSDNLTSNASLWTAILATIKFLHDMWDRYRRRRPATGDAPK